MNTSRQTKAAWVAYIFWMRRGDGFRAARALVRAPMCWATDVAKRALTTNEYDAPTLQSAHYWLSLPDNHPHFLQTQG